MPNFVEPFFGSGAVLLSRPNWTPENRALETINDASGYVSNFWRAVAADPEAVAHYADWITSENDLHARHAWLVQRKDELASRLEGDPDWFDAKIAGWWAWGMSCWIGSGFCSGNGPWQSVNGELVNIAQGDAGRGVNRQLVHLGDAGRGVNRKRVHLGNNAGRAGEGEAGLVAWMQALSERLRRVRVCCGDWTRVMGPTVTEKNGLTGIFLDPPYSDAANRYADLYEQDSLDVAHDVRRWCVENGDNPMLRVALCGYLDEHDDLESAGWEAFSWKAHGGYGSQGNGNGRANAAREVIWFSKSCLRVNTARTMSLFDLELSHA